MVTFFKLFSSLFVVVWVYFVLLQIPTGAEAQLRLQNKEQETISAKALEIDGLPTNTLVITPERQSYESGQLTLIVPKLNISTPVINGTDNKALKKGPGLYEYAQLPGEGNRNVSIAGHRDIYGSVFYNIDKLGEKDLMYLQDDKNLYEYKYRKTQIIEPDDWSVIYPQGTSCLTLTSCHPIGVSSHRIVVIADLFKITPLDENLQEE